MPDRRVPADCGPGAFAEPLLTNMAWLPSEPIGFVVFLDVVGLAVALLDALLRRFRGFGRARGEERSGGGRAEDLEIVSTGSVKLTKAFAQWYAAVNRDDAVAPLTIGQVATAFLSEAAGAHGAALLTSDSAAAGSGSDAASGLSAFAVSYAREAEPAPVGGAQDASANLPGNAEEEPATELILGSMFETREDVADASPEQFEAAVADAELLLARLSVDADVVIEGTSGMPVVSALADRLLAAGQASELYRYETLTGPPADTH